MKLFTVNYTVFRFLFNVARREHAIRSLLCRHCSLSADHTYVDKERFMLDDLKIPAEWIHEAKVGRVTFRTNVNVYSFLSFCATSVPSSKQRLLAKA